MDLGAVTGVQSAPALRRAVSFSPLSTVGVLRILNVVA